jgi:hypothetical protein
LPPNYWKFVAGAACHVSLATAWLTSRFEELGGLGRGHRISVRLFDPGERGYQSRYEILAGQQDYRPKPIGGPIGGTTFNRDIGATTVGECQCGTLNDECFHSASNRGWKARVTHESTRFRQQV